MHCRAVQATAIECTHALSLGVGVHVWREGEREIERGRVREEREGEREGEREREKRGVE